MTRLAQGLVEHVIAPECQYIRLCMEQMLFIIVVDAIVSLEIPRDVMGNKA